MKKYITPESTVMVVEVCRCLNLSMRINSQEETFSMDAKERYSADEPTSYKMESGSADEEYDALW